MSDGTKIVKKLKAALLKRDPWIEKDADVAEVMRELEDFIVWDHLLRPATEPPRDNANESAVSLLEGFTLDDSTTSSSTAVRPSTGLPASAPTTTPSPSDVCRPSTGHPSIAASAAAGLSAGPSATAPLKASDIVTAPSGEESRPSTGSSTTEPLQIKHVGPSTTITAREKLDPCFYPAYVYSRDDRHDLGLCRHAFDRKAQCPKGAECLGRHHALSEWDLAACPAIQHKWRRSLIKKYFHQCEQFTRWDQRIG